MLVRFVVQIRTTPSEQAVTISPFSKNLTSQMQPGCSMLWTQTPSARRHDLPVNNTSSHVEDVIIQGKSSYPLTKKIGPYNQCQEC